MLWVIVLSNNYLFLRNSTFLQAGQKVVLQNRHKLISIHQLFLSNKTAPDGALVNIPGVSPDYHEFTDVFSKTHASTPALHRPYDLKIELEEGTTPPFGLIYSLSQSELKSL